MKTHGSHGPSGLDANEWRSILKSLTSSSTDLCKTTAKQGIRIAKSHISFLLPYNSFRLIALDKCPGIRPIGFGKVLRRIIGRTIVKCFKTDLKKWAGDQQLRMGQKEGIAYAFHSLRAAFKNPDSEAILLIDAKNVSIVSTVIWLYKTLRNYALLFKITYVIHIVSHQIYFWYQQTMFSQEFTTQGNPLAVSMYGIAIRPLIEFFYDSFTVQKWHEDNGNGVGSLDTLKNVFDSLKKHGTDFGYNFTKCHIITKENLFEKTQQVFDQDEVEIADGCRALGSVIGSDTAEKKFGRSITKLEEIVVKKTGRSCQCYSTKRL